MKIDKILLIGGILLLAALALKSLKQFVYLSFTLLSLKIVWILLILFFILLSLKKYTSRESKK
jgi:hypothetical protein